MLVDSREQSVEGQHKDHQQHCPNQFADHPETKEPFVSGNVVDGGDRVVVLDKLVGDVDEAEGANQNEQQVPKAGDSPGVRWTHVASYVVRGPQYKVWRGYARRRENVPSIKQSQELQ